ncbi:LysR substrate-binding domain-containing protein [Chitinimonas sp. BJB300]|uniref:LysR substrate-binding domain-containing protein n=1 Tax=Chitinimonas sp. BJB300 TaxID=1559339 RepID=UPI000C0FF4D8|nr:LysR substrate-binding domain-containing protein [Chitinimonas sp. BJB300]PHV09670.1 LysR family transcriptional regulator [Chitinimonas sp. BJB300]TSJ87364.1 LysR family transcriptional regulator [Chitinimonas sp. BJB300]
MQDLNDLHYFARVVEAGGFAAAGRVIGIPKSRLSRRIAGLESRLGVRLLQRTTRKLALTEVGELYYQQCQVMLQAAEAADEAVTLLSAVPRGRLRVSCPVSLLQDMLADLIPLFLAAYPEVRLEVVMTNRRVDLLEEGIDIALRVRSPNDEDPSLVARRLLPAGGVLVMAASLRATVKIREPADLVQLPALGAIGPDRRVHWQLTGPDGRREDIALEPRLAIEDFGTRKLAALRGLGVTMLPVPYCQAELAAGTLVRLLPDWTMPMASLQAVYPHRRGLSPAARTFVEFLVQEFSKGPQRLV